MKILILIPALAVAATTAPTVPATFEPNIGQSASMALALGRGPDWSAAFFSTDVVVHYHDGARWRLRLPTGLAPKLGKKTAAATGYHSGSGDARHFLQAPIHESVVYERVEEGIDLVFHAGRSAFEVDVRVGSEADLEDFRLELDGLETARLEADGRLTLGALQHAKPQAWQEGPDGIEPVDVAYVLDEGGLGFKAAPYDRSRQLLIDPLVYSTYFGGSFGVSLPNIGVDDTGSIYLAGLASGVDFPLTPGGVVNPATPALFIAKLNPSKTGIDALDYSNFLAADRDLAIDRFEVTGSGRAYVIGTTRSRSYPVTANAFQTSLSDHTVFPANDVFVSVLDLGQGSGELIYSTYFGGDRSERALGARVRLDGRVDLFGQTDSSNIPLTSGAFDATPGGSFMATLNIGASGAASLEYSTYLAVRPTSVPAASFTTPWDAEGRLHVSGRIADEDADRLLTPTAYSPRCTRASFSGCDDAYYGVFDLLSATARGLIYGTYIPGISPVSAPVMDPQGRAYFAGNTRDVDFPDTLGLNAGDCTNGAPSCGRLDGIDVGVIGIDPELDGLASRFLSTRLGGNAEDAIWNYATDSQGRLHLVGQTNSPNFLASDNALQASCAATETFRCTGSNLFVATIDPARTGPDALIYSSTIGRSNGVELAGFDARDRVSVIGAAFRDQFPTTPGAVDAGAVDEPLQSQFVAVVDSDGTGDASLTYSTLFGGGYFSDALVLPTGRIYLTGNAVQPTLPTTPDAFDLTCGFGTDADGRCPRVAFAAILDPSPGPHLNAEPETVELIYRIPDVENPRQVVSIETNAPGLEYEITAASDDDWLSVNAERMQGSGPIEIEAKIGDLGPGEYGGRLTLVARDPFVRRTIDVGLTVEAPAPGQIAAVAHAATFAAGPVAPGQIVSVFGSGFGPRDGRIVTIDRGALTSPVGGTLLRANGVHCPILFARHDQINAVAPFSLPAGDGLVTFEVLTPAGRSAPFLTPRAEANPGLFMVGGTGRAAALNEDGSVNGPDSPAAQGSVVILFGTGGGVTEPTASADALAPATLAHTVQRADVTIGGVLAETLFSGLAPGFSGLYQFNVRVPPGLTGELEVQVAIGGISSPASTIHVQ